jgi:dUTP pyrophosphatase
MVPEGGREMKFVKKHQDAITPTRATAGSAAYDLYSADSLILAPMQRALVQTHIAIEGMAQNQCALVLSRSGLASKLGVFVLNAPGLIDSDYQGTIGVVLANFGTEALIVQPGARVAQLLFMVRSGLGDVVDAERGTGGFGSSGGVG